MAFCSNCGERLHDHARFCGGCGVAVKTTNENLSQAPEIVYEGNVHKCPRCGKVLASLTSICPGCGHEIRGAQAVGSVCELARKLAEIETRRNTYQYKNALKVLPAGATDPVDAQKISLISSFPIPNSKEDIIEFMILASSNFDDKYYMSHLNVNDVSDAWLIKIKQCYQKAKFVLSDSAEFSKLEAMYVSIIKKTEPQEIVSPPKIEPVIEKKRKSGFSSWNWFGKTMWIILNIYTFGIPAIFYAIFRRR